MFLYFLVIVCWINWMCCSSHQQIVREEQSPSTEHSGKVSESTKLSDVTYRDPRVVRRSAVMSCSSSSPLTIGHCGGFSLESLSFAGLSLADGGNITKTSLRQAGHQLYLRLRRSLPSLPVGASGPRCSVVGWTATFRSAARHVMEQLGHHLATCSPGRRL